MTKKERIKEAQEVMSKWATFDGPPPTVEQMRLLLEQAKTVKETMTYPEWLSIYGIKDQTNET